MTTGGHARPIVAPPWVFYSSPFVQKGYWLRAPLCTAQVVCDHCKSERFEPCRTVRLGKEIPKKDRKKGGPRYEEVVGGYSSLACSARKQAAAELDQSGITIEVRGPSYGSPSKIHRPWIKTPNGFTVSIPIPFPSTVPAEGV